MAESRDDPEVHWIDPSQRGTIPVDGFHISRNLRKTILSGRFSARFDTEFSEVVRQCADRDETWINQTIFDLYLDLHNRGHAHSQEVWRDGVLVGGVYGVSIGGAFFGESMFSLETNTSKMALAYLVDRLRLTGFVLFDTQFITPHLETLGAKEISRNNYLALLENALRLPANIQNLAQTQAAHDVIQRNAQTS
jgi:leucyl/phenylalanyl-tRNA--protein transferase